MFEIFAHVFRSHIMFYDTMASSYILEFINEGMHVLEIKLKYLKFV